jgi:hypothetical protein
LVFVLPPLLLCDFVRTANLVRLRVIGLSGSVAVVVTAQLKTLPVKYNKVAEVVVLNKDLLRRLLDDLELLVAKITAPILVRLF